MPCLDICQITKIGWRYYNQNNLTPHPKELERLIGNWTSEERNSLKHSFQKQYNAVIVMKGAPHIIDEILFTKTQLEMPALATAGSGDVLTGIITSLLAHRMELVDAAIHTPSWTYSDVLCRETERRPSSLQEIIKYLGKAFF
jgi:NAD(P)H-hydrate repair Nnr-like enzyme with NAD(P)H-hydrate dehydratase domain